MQELIRKDLPFSEEVIVPATYHAVKEEPKMSEPEVFEWLMSIEGAKEEKQSLLTQLMKRFREDKKLNKETKELMLSACLDLTGVDSIMSFYKFARTVFKPVENNFKFVTDAKDGTCYLVGYVAAELDKDKLIAFVTRCNQVCVLSPGKEVSETVAIPVEHKYDPEAVTGVIMEGGGVMVSFPVSEEGGAQKEKNGFQVKMVRV